MSKHTSVDLLMARKPMVYDRERNGSARSLRTSKDDGSFENLTDRSDASMIAPSKPLYKYESQRNGFQLDRSANESTFRPHFRSGAHSRSKSMTSGIKVEEKGFLSQPRYFLRNDKLKMMSDAQLQKLVDYKDDNSAKGILTMRRMSQSDLISLPNIHPENPHPTAVRSSRSEPTWIEYARPYRYYQDRYFAPSANLWRMNRSLSSEYKRHNNVAVAQKTVAFYRSFESSHPEIRMVIDDIRFPNLYELIDELSGVLQLKENERYIHSSYGTIIRDISELEDGGVYFFGPPYIYEFGQYHKFREQLTPDLIESDTCTVSDNAKVHSNRETNGRDAASTQQQTKPKEIKIVSNLDGILRPIRFLIEPRRHKSLFQVLFDLSELFSPRYGRVEGLCTRKGRTILKVSELFEDNDDEEYVAICTPVFEEAFDRRRYPDVRNELYYPSHIMRGGRYFP